MNTDTTEQNINQAIDWLQKTGGQIQDFATEQAPLYCREVVAWELWGNITSAIGSLIGLAIVFYVAKKTKSWIMEEVEDCHPGAFFGALGIIVAGVVACGKRRAEIAVSVSGAVKAAVAPRMVIIEHLRGIQK